MKLRRIILAASLVSGAACGGGSSGGTANDADDVVTPRTTAALDLPTELRGDLPTSSLRADRLLRPIVGDFEPPWPAEDVLAYPTDVNDRDLGDPASPCTPFQRLEADEFGETRQERSAWRLDDRSALVGVRVLWFETDEEAEAYHAAYAATCAGYETFNGGGQGSARGIERTLDVEIVDDATAEYGPVAVLTSGWRATINDRNWGDDILHAVQIDRFVIESTMRFFGPVAERRDEADQLSALLVDQFVSVYNG